ncbi:MAG: peptide chain release factor N(5)-glutamine methyltransferase [bacterium]|nr:peptide chain release factor N(5)-glutamine methyltransferase [bacterium]
MIIAQTLNSAAAKLKSANITLPHLEAEILLSGVLKKPREFLLTHGEKAISKMQTTKLKKLAKRRLKGEPIAYLTGHREFYGLDFLVNKNVLIPRPETELMVEEALKIAAHSSQPATLIDIGTGSGCIIITLAKLLNKELGIMNYGLKAIDISSKALTVAKKNAQIHQVNMNIKFIKGDLLTPIIHDSSFIIHNSLVILANLPYGWKAWKNNCSMDTVGLKYEPGIALFTGKNGLELYEKLFKQIKILTSKLKTGGHLLCEFDPRQTKLMKTLIKRILPEAKCQIKKDLAGLNRLAIITLSPNLLW